MDRLQIYGCEARGNAVAVLRGGPGEAIAGFLKENADFESDRTRESFFITWNPTGYLRRIR